MAYAAAILTVVGAVYGYFSNIQAGEEQASAHRYNAQVLANQARALEERAGLEKKIATEKANRVAYATKRVIGQQRADVGASGVEIAGSPLEVIAESAAQGKLSELDQLYTGELGAFNFLTEATKFKAQAGLEKYNAKLARAQASRKAYGSLLGGGAGLAGDSSVQGLFSGGGGSPYSGGGTGPATGVGGM